MGICFLSFIEFENRCIPSALDLDDRLCRYISSQQEYDLVLSILFPLILIKLMLIK